MIVTHARADRGHARSVARDLRAATANAYAMACASFDPEEYSSGYALLGNSTDRQAC
ncbi:hypothetical protein [Streptomyces erythrochromogenes]|uniref:hypothetical protein n=1 Tax=Streptomyces erythrochromogenes TaxID=285574 RepID=UPI00386AAE02|nr:hypothetical protein OG489_00340 [Streptomyces erythrochromogenes]WSR88300.1 hypothetical protein OG489_39620 [Streptomyces erythrochromogenes]